MYICMFNQFVQVLIQTYAVQVSINRSVIYICTTLLTYYLTFLPSIISGRGEASDNTPKFLAHSPHTSTHRAHMPWEIDCISRRSCCSFVWAQSLLVHICPSWQPTVFFASHHIPLCQGGLQEWALVFAAFSQQTARAAWILYHMYVGSLALGMLPLGCGRLAHSA